MMTPEIQAIFDLVQQGGMLFLLAWLYVNERRDHTITRTTKDAELEKTRIAHMNDLREWAGVRQSLYSVNPASSVPRTPELTRLIPNEN